VLDTLKIVPFLYLMYLGMEFLEHKAGDKLQHRIEHVGKAGPAIGAGLGLIPQCGFSAMAAGLFAGRVITRGTLIAIFLATSDEMLFIMISAKAPALLILKMLATKFLIGMVAGFVIDLVWRRKKEEHEHSIHDMCERAHCHCDENLFLSALHHTLHIALFLFLVTAALALVILFVGQERLSGSVLHYPVIGNLIATAVGLIPNCASSVLLTELYLSSAISGGALISGLLAGSGVGMLMLLRVHSDKKENALILGVTCAIAFVCGTLLDVTTLAKLLF
jgi:hypothetical protein